MTDTAATLTEAQADARRDALIEALSWAEDLDTGRWGYDTASRLLDEYVATRLAAQPPQPTPQPDERGLLEPWGPSPMGGFEGCTDVNPDVCACGTDEQPTCEVCGQEIEPGEQAWSRQWPCYNTLPLDDPGQDWDVIHWHDQCPTPVPTDAPDEEAGRG